MIQDQADPPHQWHPRSVPWPAPGGNGPHRCLQGALQSGPSVGELNHYDTLADAQLPAEIQRRVNAALGIREEVIHRDIW